MVTEDLELIFSTPINLLLFLSYKVVAGRSNISRLTHYPSIELKIMASFNVYIKINILELSNFYF
jgi:hypothetical protein